MSHGQDRADREAAIIRDLMRAENLPEVRGEVALATTHGSLVFLGANDVFKLKRAVDFGFFDFTTLAARKHDCEMELELNRRTAPSIYLDMLPVRLDATGYSLTREGGEIVDWAVHMQRLPTERGADTMLRDGRLTVAHLQGLAAAVADFYRSATLHEPALAELRANFEENFTQSTPFVGRFVEQTHFDELVLRQRTWLDDQTARLATRPARDGHGDLRLEHVYFLETGPTLIDCIEFNDRFRIADPALDVAFFAMDLERAARADLAVAFLAAFAYETDDYGFWPLIDGYASYRAFVRAKVACFVADDPATSREVAARKASEASVLFELARRLLEPRRQGRVIAIGGMPASGKSSVARALSARLQGVIVSADATRKALAGVAKADSAGTAAYSADFSKVVQEAVLERTELVLESGRTVIVDTTFRRRETRAGVVALARQLRVPFTFVECVAPEDVLRERIRARHGDVSDADERVLDEFLSDADPIDEFTAAELVRLDTTAGERAIEIVAQRLTSR